MASPFTVPSTSPSALPSPGWWQRNWKWFVPLACVVAMTLFVATIVAFILGIFGVLKSSEPSQVALARASSSSEVQAALGTPITTGFLVTGSINFDGSTGRAELEVPISGPAGKGKIHVMAHKTAGEWTYTRMDVVLAVDGRRISLVGTTDTPLELEAAPDTGR